MTSITMPPAEPTLEHALTASELDRARLYLEETGNGVLGAVRRLSEAQWNFKPGPERWSIAENVAHIIFVQDRVLGPLHDQLRASAPAAPHPDYQRVDDIVIYQFPNRLAKFSSPVPAAGIPHSEGLQRLSENCARLRNRLESTPDLRTRSAPAVPLKLITSGAYETLDGYQWILAAAAHTERHTKQILEVMADPAFPV
jgi:hypothetical protein